VSTAVSKPSLGERTSAPRYRWLLFDADGTLFDYDRAERAALEKVFAQIGVSFDPGYLAAYRRINQTLWQGVEKGEITPGVVKVRRFELLLEAIQVAYSPTAFSASYLEAWLTARNWWRALKGCSGRCTRNIALPF